MLFQHLAYRFDSIHKAHSPTLDYIINKRLFLNNQAALPPSNLTSYFLIVDHALARFGAMLADKSKWGSATIREDVFMMSKPQRGNSMCLKAIADIAKPPKMVFNAIVDWEEQLKWNDILAEGIFLTVPDFLRLI